MNSWRWQINGSILSAACHQRDSKCYSNEAVIIVKLRGSILSKGRVQGNRWRRDDRTRGQSSGTKGYSTYLKHLLEAWLPIHHALNNPSQLKWETNRKQASEKCSKDHQGGLLSCTSCCNQNILLWPTWTLLWSQPQQSDPCSSPATGKGIDVSQTQRCRGAKS